MDVSDYIGIPFRLSGRDRAGIDCYGLVRLVYWESLGVALPEYGSRYDADSAAAQLAETIEGAAKEPEWETIPLAALREFDVLRFRTFRLTLDHVGLFVGKGTALHTTEKTGSIAEPLDRLRTCVEPVCAYRLKEAPCKIG